jgi:hypothetical protein
MSAGAKNVKTVSAPSHDRDRGKSPLHIVGV